MMSEVHLAASVSGSCYAGRLTRGSPGHLNRTELLLTLLVTLLFFVEGQVRIFTVKKNLYVTFKTCKAKSQRGNMSLCVCACVCVCACNRFATGMQPTN